MKKQKVKVAKTLNQFQNAHAPQMDTRQLAQVKGGSDDFVIIEDLDF